MHAAAAGRRAGGGGRGPGGHRDRAAVTALAARLLATGWMVTLEATRDYWRILYYVLEAAGLAVQLVNSAQARQLEGRPRPSWTRSGWPG